jgi:hypothetical protein
MSTIETLKAKLTKYPHARFTATDTSILVEPHKPDGFEVRLDVRSGTFTVSFEGWHEEFESEDEALNCFAFGLSSACRLRIDFRGRFPYRWTVESLQDGQWVADSTTGLLIFPFWRRRRTEHRQNHLISAA